MQGGCSYTELFYTIVPTLFFILFQYPGDASQQTAITSIMEPHHISIGCHVAVLCTCTNNRVTSQMKPQFRTSLECFVRCISLACKFMISKTEGNQHYSHQLPPIENLLKTLNINSTGTPLSIVNVWYIIFQVKGIRVRDRFVHVPGFDYNYSTMNCMACAASTY